MYFLQDIYVYPVKSLVGIRVEAARITDRGLEHDRRWMLVDEAGMFITQREAPLMALFSIAITTDGLLIQYKGDNQPLLVPFIASGMEIKVKVWDSTVRAADTGSECAAWFSERLGRKLRLVHMPDDSIRICNPRVTAEIEKVSFADGYPYLILGEPSLDFLNSKLESPVTMDRFRPNLVFTGGEPHVEDTWKSFRIGNAEFVSAKPCSRCAITTVDQATGIKGTEPLKTLAGYRSVDNKVRFGMNTVCNAGEVLTAGEIEILEYL